MRRKLIARVMVAVLGAALVGVASPGPAAAVPPPYAGTSTFIDLNWPATSPGGPVEFDGWLAFLPGGVSSAQTLHVSRQDALGLHALPDVTTDAEGHFVLSDTPIHHGSNIYTFRYPGTESQAPASTSVTVLVDGTTSELTLTAPSTGKRAAKLTLRGTLTLSGKPVPAPWTLQVVRKDAAGSTKLPAVTATSAGAFSVSDTPPVGGNNTYTVTFVGDNFVTGSTRSAVVSIAHDPTTLRLTTKADPKKWAPKVTVTAYLGKTHTNRKVCLYAKSHGEGQRTLKCGYVNSSGNLKTTDLISTRTVFTAKFTGDHRHAPATVTSVVKPPANVTVALISPSYTKSGKYRVFKRKSNPVTKSWVSPETKGVCMYYTVQKYTSGKWRTVSTSKCHKLNSASQGKYTYKGKRTVGVNYRVRAKFAGNTANKATNSYWEYFRFRN
ncbi:hypothetical protein [Micromonospora sp. WMMD1082]|uniref:hypothetical protein n=1 Tax=Micromonospora sp. WMMD1082 TaxID=3016104 RepID=UPI00241700CE|nr:hypothetical protein [Micromonospora sp. WMMD1082]MDG4795776.1 hypothetical protein [Micromonospora sp. WMMD1082]